MATILVTEADAGFGAELSVSLAADGHRVAAASRSGNRPPKTERHHILAGVELDLEVEESVRAGVSEVSELFAGIDVVICNGAPGEFGAVEHVASSAFDRAIAINLTGQVRVLAAASPHLRESGRGQVIGLSSLAAIVGLPGRVACSASRAGFEAALQCLRYELLPWNVRVSVIQPGHPPTSAQRVSDDHVTEDPYQNLRVARLFFGQPLVVTEHDLTIQVVRNLLDDDDPPFRTPLAPFAELAIELTTATDQEIDTAVHDLFEVGGQLEG